MITRPDPDLATELAAPFAILHILGDEESIHHRLIKRQLENRDASEADMGVHEMLKATTKPLTKEKAVYRCNSK
ncbi:ATP-binding protein [Methylomonas albis]|uniref:Uncharacterized protein n=1 Tax=Methylomonas albis TaxID=1854563 RepID=A0ABR9D289_9GAMM|nr:hypothetical protein [Methylomonas albis]MBD9357197.1 hypothetical protein [Methylomonas albis]